MPMQDDVPILEYLGNSRPVPGHVERLTAKTPFGSTLGTNTTDARVFISADTIFLAWCHSHAGGQHCKITAQNIIDGRTLCESPIHGNLQTCWDDIVARFAATYNRALPAKLP